MELRDTYLSVNHPFMNRAPSSEEDGNDGGSFYLLYLKSIRFLGSLSVQPDTQGYAKCNDRSCI